MKKKVLSLIVAIVMVLTMLPVMGLATNTPPAVTINSITSADGKVMLSWNAAAGVDGYRVHRKTGSGKWTTVVASTKSTSYTDTNVTVGTTYTYAIRSYIGDTYSTGYNETAKSIKVVSGSAAEPKPVTISSITSANGKVTLSWNAVPGVDGYRVHRKTGSGKWTTVVASTKSTSYTDTNVTVGTTYTYAIRSYIGDTYSTGYNETAKSIKVTAGTAEPPAVTINSISSSNGKVTLSWNAVPGVDGYRVHRKTGSGKWTTVVASTKSTSYTDTNVTVGTTYTYAIRSYIGDTYSSGYNDTAKSIKVTAGTAEPPAVTINSISSANGKVTLSWNAAAGVDGYRVHRKTGSGKWTTVVASTKSTSYTDTNVTVGTTYTYAIRSYIGDTYSTGYNDTAKSIKVTAAAADPPAVTINSIASANGKVTLSWNAAAGVDGYRVHRKTGSGKWTTIVASTTATSYTDTNVTVGTTYTYAIRSYIGDTYSTGYNDTAKSIKVTAGTAEPPAVMINSIASANGKVMLSWNAVPGVDGYRVHRKTGSGKWTTIVASTTATSLTDTNVTVGTTYTYAIRSYIGDTYSTGYNETAKSIKASANPDPLLEFDASTGAITGLGEKSVKAIVIPETINGVKVTSIADGAFYGCSAVESIDIPSSVLSVGDYAFRMCTSLKSIALPEGVSKIGARTFYNCKSMTEVTIPSSVTYIDESAFDMCSGLKDVYYSGSSADWENINIQSGNDALDNATIHCASAAEPTLTVSKVTASAGESVNVAVSVKDNPGILGMVLKLTYDTNALTLKSAKNGTATSALNMTAPGSLASPCKFMWDGVSISGSDIKDGEVLVLTFEVSPSASAGTYPVTISYDSGDITDNDLRDVSPTVTNGSVTVSGGGTVSTAPTLTVSKVTASAGESVDVAVSVKNNPGILGMVLKLTYDTNALTLKSAKNGTATSALNMTAPGSLASPCKFMWDGVSISGSDIKDGEVLVLTFEVSPSASSGTYPVTISYNDGDITDNDLRSLTVDTNNGSVTVK